MSGEIVLGGEVWDIGQLRLLILALMIGEMEGFTLE